MARPSWLVDSNRIATKIKSASCKFDPTIIHWKSNPTRACPNCQHIIDNTDVSHEWPGLPRGVKFDPSDQEIILHLLAKAGLGDSKPHPFIDEFIPTVDKDDGICYTHPQKLPGVKQDGSASHFFHRAVKAYNTGNRKRRKINGDDLGDVRWHKTGRTKPVILDGIQRGCKKIMVLYMSPLKGGKAEKTNWVMHQYHLGTGEDEKEGEFVMSKVFYQQQQQLKQSDKVDNDIDIVTDDFVFEVDPVTPKSVTPEPPRSERDHSDFDEGQQSPNFMEQTFEHPEVEHVEDMLQREREMSNDQDRHKEQNPAADQAEQQEWEMPHQDNIKETTPASDPTVDRGDNHGDDDPKWWDSESQYLLDSQQLVEGLSLCDELLQSQSPGRDERGNNGDISGKPRLSDYAQLGPEDLKKDLEECQHIVLDPANIELDTPPDFRLSQLEFGSQESFIAWGGSKMVQ